MRFLRSRYFIICVLVAIIIGLVPALLAAFGGTDILRSAVKTVAKPFETVGSYVADGVGGFFSVFSDYDDLKAENEELRARISELEEERRDNAVLREENSWLKEFLGIHATNPEFLFTDARIISHSSGSYSTVLTLDKGRVHGVLKNMPVITSDGAFGYVSEVGLDWCKVVSVIETASQVGGYDQRSGARGYIEGSLELRESGLCRMVFQADADIMVDDRICTEGGEHYPSGLYVGRIAAIEADPSTRTLVATIEPAVDFSDLDSLGRVMIISGYAS